jgi:nucleoside-diphosphate-sugar epimerase
MVIGNGMIAKEFESYRDIGEIIIFASGVSDSGNTDAAAFERELNLIIETIKNNKDKLFVYFSTCSIYDLSMLQSPYVRHKIKMENFIMEHCPQFIIFRITNPIGYTKNTHTVVNYFIKNIFEKHEFEVWENASRNIIDLDDMYLVCNAILQQKMFTNSIVNVANPKNYPVLYIIHCIEKHFDIKGNYSVVNKGGGPVIDTGTVDSLYAAFNIHFNEDYLPKLLQKYFKNSTA